MLRGLYISSFHGVLQERAGKCEAKPEDNIPIAKAQRRRLWAGESRKLLIEIRRTDLRKDYASCRIARDTLQWNNRRPPPQR